MGTERARFQPARDTSVLGLVPMSRTARRWSPPWRLWLAMVATLALLAGSVAVQPAPAAAAVSGDVSAELVQDIVAGGGGSSPTQFAAVGDEVVFKVGTDQLWISDGTAEGTELVRTFGNTLLAGIGANFAVIGDTVYFAASDDDTVGNELWKSDGTPAGTTLVKDLELGASSNPRKLTVAGGRLYLVAQADTAPLGSGGRLWTSDGTEAGTSYIDGNNNASMFGDLTAVGTKLYYPVNNTLKVVSGTTVTGLRTFVSSNPSAFAALDDTTVLFAASGANTVAGGGRELWKSNGTATGTVRVKDINPGAGQSLPSDLARVGGPGGDIFFRATPTGGFDAFELWRTDGSTDGTVPVLRPNPTGDSSIGSLTDVAGTLFFAASDGAAGIELWSSDGTPVGTGMVQDLAVGSTSSSPRELRAFDDLLLFTAEAGSGRLLRVSDGTAGGTGTVLDEGDVPLATGLASGLVVVAPGRAFLAADNGTSGTEPWKVTAGSAPANDAPGYTAPRDQTADTGVREAVDLGSFTDRDEHEQWSIDVDWGDGTDPESFTVTEPGDLGNRDHTYATSGAMTVTVTVSDGLDGDGGSFTVTVTDAVPGVYSARFGQPLQSDGVLNTTKLGRVIPVKVVVTASDGSAGAGPVSFQTRSVPCTSTGAGTETIDTRLGVAGASTGNRFRWDADGERWIFNLDTRKLGASVGSCHQLDVYHGGTEVNGNVDGGDHVGSVRLSFTR